MAKWHQSKHLTARDKAIYHQHKIESKARIIAAYASLTAVVAVLIIIDILSRGHS